MKMVPVECQFLSDTLRQLRLDSGHCSANFVGDIEHVRARSDLDTDEHRAPAVEGNTEIIRFCAQDDRSHIFQAHDRIVLLTHDEAPKLLDGVQIRRGSQIHADHPSFARADGR
jgi:hypothetical protein